MNEFTPSPRSAQGAYGIAGEYVTSEAITSKSTTLFFLAAGSALADWKNSIQIAIAYPFRLKNRVYS